MKESRNNLMHKPVSNLENQDITCRATECLFNVDFQCIAPANFKLDDDGQCLGFTRAPEPEKAS